MNEDFLRRAANQLQRQGFSFEKATKYKIAARLNPSVYAALEQYIDTGENYEELYSEIKQHYHYNPLPA